jgi:hypothetical protein
MSQMGAHPGVNHNYIHPAFNINQQGIPPVLNGNPHGIHPAFNIRSMDTFAAASFTSNSLEPQRQLANYNDQHLASRVGNPMNCNNDFRYVQSMVESHQISINEASNGNNNCIRPSSDPMVQASQNLWSVAAMSSIGQWPMHPGILQENRKRAHPEPIPSFGPQSKRASPGPLESQSNDQLREVVMLHFLIANVGSVIMNVKLCNISTFVICIKSSLILMFFYGNVLQRLISHFILNVIKSDL